MHRGILCDYYQVKSSVHNNIQHVTKTAKGKEQIKNLETVTRGLGTPVARQTDKESPTLKNGSSIKGDFSFQLYGSNR